MSRRGRRQQSLCLQIFCTVDVNQSFWGLFSSYSDLASALSCGPRGIGLRNWQFIMIDVERGHVRRNHD